MPPSPARQLILSTTYAVVVFSVVVQGLTFPRLAARLAARAPPSVVNKLNQEIAAILKQPETGKRFAAEGAEPEALSPAELRKMVLADLTKWAKVAQDAKMEKH